MKYWLSPDGLYVLEIDEKLGEIVNIIDPDGTKSPPVKNTDKTPLEYSKLLFNIALWGMHEMTIDMLARFYLGGLGGGYL